MPIHLGLPKLPSFLFDIDVKELFAKLIEKRKFRNTGLFIGKEFVDLVELRRGLSGPRLVNFISTPIQTKPQAPETPQDPSLVTPSEEGSLSTHEKILSAIRRAVREGGFRSRNVVSSLSEEEVIVRYFQMPRLPRKDWDQAIRFEARKYIPFTLEELVSDFSVIEDKKEKGKMVVVFVAAKKEVVARHLALLSKADLKVSHLEALPFSFMRLLYALDPASKKEKCICIIDIAGTVGTIILIKEGLPYLIRHVSLESLGEEIEAPSEVSQGSVPFPSILGKLLDEVRLTSRYYRNQFPGENISRILIFGEGLNKEFPEMLTRELNLPVSVGDLSRVVNSQIPHRLARTVGLGLRGLAGAGREIELLPPKEGVVPSQQTKFFKSILLEGVGVVIVLFALFSILSHRVTLQQGILHEIRKASTNISSLSKADLEKEKGDLSQKVSFYRNFLDQRIFLTKKLNRLGNVLPKGAWVTSLLIQDHLTEGSFGKEVLFGLTLKGAVYNPDKAEELKIPSQFLSAIQQDEDFFEGFDQAKLISVKRNIVEDVGVTFFEILLIRQER